MTTILVTGHTGFLLKRRKRMKIMYNMNLEGEEGPGFVHGQIWRPREVKYAYSSYAKSERLLGYKEEIGYEEGIRRMAKWVKAKGPQEWVQEQLPLQNDKMPKTWK